jgi:hypothetical protein
LGFLVHEVFQIALISACYRQTNDSEAGSLRIAYGKPEALQEAQEELDESPLDALLVKSERS